MRFETPVLQGRFLRRYKRFFADIELDGQVAVAHVPNTGSLRGCLVEGAPACVTRAANPKRKLGYTLELLRADSTWVGVNTSRANGLVEEAIRAGTIAELTGYSSLKREVKYGESSRVDLLLEEPGRAPCYVEVKSVTLGRAPLALFPDAISTRAAKHMVELARQVAAGARACVVFAVQREDCDAFAPADEIDPKYGVALRQAAGAGVMVVAYRAEVSPDGITLKYSLPVRL
jgi:sugar fermentation stimulation protein A